MKRMRLVILSFAFLLVVSTGLAQSPSKFDFFAGYGYYEGYNIGSEYYFDQRFHSISLSIGYDRLKRNNQESFSLTLGYNFAILRDHRNKSENFKWNVSNRAVLWQLEDDFYLWRAVSLIPSISRRFNVYKSIDMSIDAGPSFNIVLYNDRKTFKEVGWPYHVMPNARILFIF
jgi:hypothetical protein